MSISRVRTTAAKVHPFALATARTQVGAGRPPSIAQAAATADALLARHAGNYQALDTTGLALSGLAVTGEGHLVQVQVVGAPDRPSGGRVGN